MKRLNTLIHLRQTSPVARNAVRRAIVAHLIAATGLLVMAGSAANAAIPALERQALLDIYAQTNGASWVDVLPTWNGAAGTECSWGGVTCDVAQTTVTAISLPQKKLTGSLPASLNQLTSLRSLDLSGNRLGGAIPALTGLVNLQSLLLSRNELSGSIPSLSSLAALIRFDVRTNLLTGTLPSLAGLGNLTAINVANNLLSGAIPDVPSPNRLAEAGSMLCPNNFTESRSSAWDSATPGYSWSRDCTYAWGAVPVSAANGTIYPSTRQMSGTAGTIVFDIVPAPGYGAIVVGTCDRGLWRGNTYEISFDTGFLPPPVPGPDCTVEPVFSNGRFNVTVTSVGNGSTTPVGVSNVLFGTQFSVTVTAAPGHRALLQSDCSAFFPPFGAVSQITRTDEITHDCSVNVEYLPVFTVTPPPVTYAYFWPPEPVTVLQGGSARFSIIPLPGYAIASVTGCGGSLSGDQYVTGPITADCEIVASFSFINAPAALPVPVSDGRAALALLTLLLLSIAGVALAPARRRRTRTSRET